jgi:hypothetical protein
MTNEEFDAIVTQVRIDRNYSDLLRAEEQALDVPEPHHPDVIDTGTFPCVT